jgi:hypothetical protein
MNQEIYNAYVDSGANQMGGDLPYFVGRQYGGASSWLGSLVKMAFPILLKKLFGLGRSIADDVISKKKSFGESVKDHATSAVEGIVRSSKDHEDQKGSGSTINRRKRKRNSKSFATASSFPLFAKQRKIQ